MLQAFLLFAGGTLIQWAWCAGAACVCSRAMARFAAGMLAGALFSAEFACLFAGLQYTTASRLPCSSYVAAVGGRHRAADGSFRAPAAAAVGGVLLAFVAIVRATRKAVATPPAATPP